MPAERQPEAPIRRYLTMMRRRIWILVAFAVAVPAAAVGYSVSQSKLYRATSTVLINRQSVANQLQGATDVGLQQQSFQQVLVTQARLARTPDVLRSTLSRAGDDGGGLTVARLRASSTVQANPDSDLLTFDVVRPDADSARRLALVYAHAYVQYRRKLDSTALNRALQAVNDTLAEASRRRGPAGGALVTGLSTSRQQLETRIALQSANAQVVAGPDEATQVRPQPVRNGILGVVVGLLLGFAAVFLRNTLDSRVRTSEEAESLLETPILSRIPRPQGGRNAHGLAMFEEFGGVRAEGFRMLRTNLSFGLLSSDAKVLMVTSSAQSEGKSTTIANLAVASAIGGKRVAIVDLDLRRPSLVQLFGVPGGPGLAGVALGQIPLADALKTIDLERASRAAAMDPHRQLDLLASGALPPDPSEFINSDAVRGIVRELRQRYDLVLLDAPPLVAVSDTSVIADLADAVFVCVRLGIARRMMLTELRKGLDRLTIPVLGQVIAGAESDDIAGYQGYYMYEASASRKPPAPEATPTPR